MRRVPLITDDGDVKQVAPILHPMQIRAIRKRADEMVAERWPGIVAKLDAAEAKRARRRARNLGLS